MTLGKKAIGIVLILVLLGSTIPFSYGVELQLKTMGNRWLTLKNPTICVHESFDPGVGVDYDKVYKITKIAAKNWEDILVEKSGGNREDWKIYVEKKPGTNDPFIKTGHYINCDTNVVLRGAPTLNLDSSYIPAYVQHFSNFRMWHDIMLYTWEYSLAPGSANQTAPIHYLAITLTDEKMERVIMHEIGHTLGLKHTTWDGKEWSGPWCDQRHADVSVMYIGVGCQNIKVEIEEIDYTTLIYKFGTDGWGGYTNLNFEELNLSK